MSPSAPHTCTVPRFLLFLMCLLLLQLPPPACGGRDVKRPRRPGSIESTKKRQKEGEYKYTRSVKQKQIKKQRKKQCNHINTTIEFDNDKDRNIWQLYNCPVLLNFRKAVDADKKMQHTKCSDFYRGRQAAEQWCLHANARRVFDSKKDERTWIEEQCDVTAAALYSSNDLRSMNEQERKRIMLKRKVKTINTLKNKFQHDQWCFITYSTLKEQNSHIRLSGNTDEVVSMLHTSDRVKWGERDCLGVMATYGRDYHVCTADTNIGTKSDTNNPLIAIMASSTSRNHNFTNGFTNIPLFKTLLPSLTCTLDCGFRYTFVLGYDEDDPFYDSPNGLRVVGEWFSLHVAVPLSIEGISVSLHHVRVSNPLRRPGPVFIAMAQAAHALHAEYFYRVNDDSEFLGRWPSLYTNTLQQLTPPGLGVVGPSCYDSKDRILTHDFVHRLHMEIFDGLYYPPEFSDWYMDDWISAVYGPQRTFLSKRVGIDHHNRHKERTYEVNRENIKLLPSLIKSGQLKIEQWMKTHGVSDVIVAAFTKDVATTDKIVTGKTNQKKDDEVVKYSEIF